MSIEVRIFKADAGVKWFKAGWEIFKLQPLTFILMHLLIVIISFLVLLLPLLQVVGAFVTPFLMAGFYQAVLTKQQGGTISQADIFKPFSNKGNRIGLVRVAVYQMAAGILLALLSNFIFADAYAVISSQTFDPQNQSHIADLLATISMGQVAVFLLAICVYLTAFAYAVPLVYFQKQSNMFQVLKTSFMVFYHNMAPLSVYGLICAVLMVICIPLSFIPLLVLMPICYISFFVSFQAIFMPVVPKGDDQTKAPEAQSQSGRFDA